MTEKGAVTVNPDWSKVTSTIDLGMISGQTYNNSLNDVLHFGSPGNTTRDPLALYPLWQATFSFNQYVGGGITGLQVGVWGDTKEIAYCGTMGYLGDSGTPLTSTDQPTATANQPTQFPVSPIVILSIVVAAIVVLLAAIVINKKSR
jgi:hypothetical protein